MATTTLGTTNTTTDRKINTYDSPVSRTDNRTIYWGIAIAIVLALAVILTVRATSTRDMLTQPAAATIPPVNNRIQDVPPTDVNNNNAATYNDSTTNNNGTTEPQRTDVAPRTIPTDSTQPVQQ